MSLIRSRWAATGAAVAVTLGAGGVGLVGATSPSDAAAFVPVTPCRVIDTRPDFQVGPRSTPLGAGDIVDVVAVGTSGNCDGVPASATGVVLNVTATDATFPTFLTVWRAGQERPDASSLNPSPGQPPTPNAVTSGLNDEGEFSIYNFQGSVHVLADIVGYYVDHHHDDRYYTEDETDAALTAKADTTDVYTKTQTDAALSAKADATDVYTKTEADAAVEAARDDVWGYVIGSNGNLHAASGNVRSIRLGTGHYCIFVSERASWKGAQATIAQTYGTYPALVTADTGHGNACFAEEQPGEQAIPLEVFNGTGTRFDADVTFFVPAP